MLRYVQTGEDPDVSRAVRRMFERDILPAMKEGHGGGGPGYEGHADGALQDSNDFRRRACYMWETDDVITEHKKAIKAIFDGYAKGEAGGDAALQELLSLEEWQALMTDAELIDDEFTMREAVLAFVWSRHRVVDERPPKARTKLTNLSLEDFYEALMRVATMKGLPTDDELTEAFLAGDFGDEEVPDAGTYVLTMRNDPTDKKQVWRAPAIARSLGYHLPSENLSRLPCFSHTPDLRVPPQCHRRSI